MVENKYSNQLKKEDIVIIGDGEFAEIAYEYFTYDSPYNVVAFAVEKEYMTKESLFGLPVVPFEKIDNLYPKDKYKVFTAITFTKLNRVRTRLYNEAKAKGYKFVSYVSSNAFVWRNAHIGENTFIFEKNIIQYNVNIGNNVVLWSGNNIAHRTSIGDNCYISAHVAIAGYCKILENCFFGINSTLVDNTTIAKDTIVGAGAVIVKDILEEGKIYVGSPAKPISKTSYEKFGLGSFEN